MTTRDALIEAMAQAMCEALLETGRTDWGGPVPAPNYYGAARKALAAIEAAGVRLVPVDATIAMTHTVSVQDIPLRDVNGWYEDLDIQAGARVIYAAMLAASPYAPAALRTGE